MKKKERPLNGWTGIHPCFCETGSAFIQNQNSHSLLRVFCYFFAFYSWCVFIWQSWLHFVVYFWLFLVEKSFINVLCVCVLPLELKDFFVLYSPVFAHIPPPQNFLSMLLLLVISVYNCTLLWEDAAHSWCYEPLMTFWSLACFCPAVLLYKVSSPVVVLEHVAVKSSLTPIYYKMIHMGNSL